MPSAIRRAAARSILSRTSGFIAQAGFSHSLTPARNCTFACTYCYVPTMRVQGGLQPEDWRRWGQFTTFKSNAAELLERALRPQQVIYCSPLVDPYQPAEATEELMPGILRAFLSKPPAVVAIQTRGPLILRDLDLLRSLAGCTRLRVSFSLTTDRDEVRRLYEPHCATVGERLHTMCALRDAGIRTYATLAPLLPCDPERLVDLAAGATAEDMIADPFHVRSRKACGATTREAGRRVSEHHGYGEWHDPEFQDAVIARMRDRAARFGRRLEAGPAAFGWLADRKEYE